MIALRDLTAFILLNLLIHLSYADRVEDPLSDLRWHWGDAYVINCLGLGKWTAERRDTHETLHANSPLGLRDKIVADYSRRRVSRDP